MKTLFYSVQPEEKALVETKLAGRNDIVLIDQSLSAATADKAEKFDAVCVTGTDDLSAHVLEALYKHGVRYITIRAAHNHLCDLASASLLGMVVARVPMYAPDDGTTPPDAIEYMLDVTLYNLDCRRKDIFSGNELTRINGQEKATIYYR
ncbi:MAG TPA: hypothetical protein VL307_06015 [Chitinophagaceae bacterium]|nr:hypothetical protein [Chitinophagaceae bacterium]